MAAHQAFRDDRVLSSTKALSAFIAPFLIVAFVVLYVFPSETGRLFAWTIRPTMTPMVLASAYLGGFYFFVRALRASRWAALRLGLQSVGLFATLLGVATIIHWDRFNHRHVAFWLWAGLYFVAPVLVVLAYVANRRHARPPLPEELRLGRGARGVIGVMGVAAVGTGLTMFLAPAVMIPLWPWALTPLTCRVVGAIFCLGLAGIGTFLDPRWVAIRLMVQVEALMVLLMLLAAIRAWGELLPGRPFSWLMLVGFAGLLVGSAYLWYAYEVAPQRSARETAEAHS
jgi:drug/metabolite transporter (DMT)-like permease